MMEEGLVKLYTGDFNRLSSEEQPDGSKIYKLTKQGENKTYVFRVKNLYQEDEEVLEHKVIDHAIPGHIKNRMSEAKKSKVGKTNG